MMVSQRLTLSPRLTLQQKLTPQQIQYLKLLQLPIQELEQQINTEIEENPFLEIAENTFDSASTQEQTQDNKDDSDFHLDLPIADNIGIDFKDFDESKDPFEFYRKIWEEDEIMLKKQKFEYSEDDEENEPFQIKAPSTLFNDLISQFRLHNLSEEEYILGEQILGNIDPDGYLRTDLAEIVDDTNAIIAEINLKREEEYKSQFNPNNPATNFIISLDAQHRVSKVVSDGNKKIQYLEPVTLADAERVLSIIQSLDPPGVGSRNLQECLLAQAKSFPEEAKGRNVAIIILSEGYEKFSKKHFEQLKKQLKITEDELKEAIDFIKRLNPKPGYPDIPTETNVIIPDFIVDKDPETGELRVTLNDGTIPTLKINKLYEQMRKDAQIKNEKEAKEWMKQKYEQAKFIIQALSQRKKSMLKIMTAIVARQKDFFYYGKSALKPMIYKNIADDTGLDIATVCRIVNNKFVQTEFGIFELKYFFSESLPSENGEEVSTKVIKEKIKEIIENEPKDRPFSDEQIVDELNKLGYKVARRTVAKYREQMKIPIARLRKEL